MFKRITGILLACVMMTTICCSAVEISYTVVATSDTFETYTTGENLPCGTGEKWEKTSSESVWTATVAEDFYGGNQVLQLEKPDATIEPDSNSLITSRLSGNTALTGDVDVSFKILVPSFGTAPSGKGYNLRQQNYDVRLILMNVEGNDLFGESCKLWMNHRGNPKISVGEDFYDLEWDAWCEVRFVLSADQKTVDYYINNTTQTPTITKSINNRYNISYFGFRPDQALPESYFHIDDFKIVHTNTEMIDEASMTIMYMPKYNGETRAISIEGTTRPYFGQNAQATIYSADGGTQLASTESVTGEGGTFSLDLSVPGDAGESVLLDVSSDYLPESASGRKIEILVYEGSLDEEISKHFTSHTTQKEETILMLNSYLPQVISRPAWFAYLENKDFYAEYFVENAKQAIVCSTAQELGEAFRKATVILDLNSADEDEIIEKLNDYGFVNLNVLSETTRNEFNRIWRENKQTEAFTCESEVAFRVDSVMSVALVNCAKRSEIGTLVKKYKDVFNLTDQDVAPKDLDFDVACAQLFQKGYTYPSEVCEAVKASIKELSKQGSDTNKNSSSDNKGGGGSRSDKSISVSTGIMNQKPEIAPDVKQDAESGQENHPDAEKSNIQFGDIENHWAKAAIYELVKENVINGYEDETFKPENQVSRAEYIAMITRLLKLEDGVAGFADVKADAWYAGVIGAAEKAGLIQGSDNYFFPARTITRQDAAVILYRMLGEPEAVDTASVFIDSDTIASYAEKAVNVLSSIGIINGLDGKFEPLREISRAETAKILCGAATVLKS